MIDADKTIDQDDDTRPDEKLDAIISKALDGGAEPDEAPPSADRTLEKIETSAARDELGRFKSKPADEGGTDAPAAKPPVTETAPIVEAKPAEPAPQAPAWTDGHFTGWKPGERERFNALPPKTQELVMERQAAERAFNDRKLAEVQQRYQAYEPLVEAGRQIEPFAQQFGASPDQLLRNYANLEYKMTFGTLAEKLETFETMARRFNVPYVRPEIDPYADPLQPNGQAYAAFHDQQSQLARIQSELAMERAQRERMQEAQIASHVQAFVNATNADGSPKYPLFNEVRASMGQYMADGRANSMEEAYQLAVKPIQDRINAEIAARMKQASEAQAQVVARAKRATPIRTSENIPNGKSKGMNLDAIIDQSLTQAGFN